MKIKLKNNILQSRKSRSKGKSNDRKRKRRAEAKKCRCRKTRVNKEKERRDFMQDEHSSRGDYLDMRMSLNHNYQLLFLLMLPGIWMI